MSLSISHCEGCGLAIEPGGGTDCSRCGYPLHDEKEEAFLRKSLYDLWRVTQYGGGANISVAQLIDRYQRRLAFLSQRTASSPAESLPAQEHLVPDTQRSGEKRAEPNPVQHRSETTGMRVIHSAVASGPQGAPSKQTFSAQAFFADQTINIVASLGAFLILIGSLSFIATTSDLLLAFIVLLVVHTIFGSIGAITYRFASLHTVSVIYTTIFTLQVPLVGFAAYRFVAGSAFHVSASLMIAVAAGYAAGTYGVLAVYQKFKPFGYLAAVALFVMDLATASTLHLAIWWWPGIVMLLAFPLLTFVRRPGAFAAPLSPARSILREPARVLLGVCVTGSVLCALFIAQYSLLAGGQDSIAVELRFSLVVMSLLFSAWLALFIWRTKRYEFMSVAPYLCTTCVLALFYAFSASRSGYVLVLTALAILFCSLARFDLRFFNGPQNKLEQHLETLALILVASMPFIAAPGLLPQIVEQTFFLSPAMGGALSFELIMDIVVLLVGCLLTLSVLLRHTGRQKVLTAKQAEWSWLLLLCGFLCNYAYALAVVSLGGVLIWAMLGFFLFCIVLAMYTRRFLSNSWANPLDVLSICVLAALLLLSLKLDSGSSIVLLLCMSGLFYVLALYQQRQLVFPLFLICALMALFHLFNNATITLFILALLLPFVSVGVHHILLHRMKLTALSQQQWQRSVFAWEWPLLLMSIVYGVGIASYDSMTGASMLRSVVPMSTVVELAVLALVWYMAGVLAQNRWWSAVAIGFGLWGIWLVPQTLACQIDAVGADSIECLRQGQFVLYYLAGVALFSAIAGLCIDWLTRGAKRSDRAPVGFDWQIKWSWPWYVVSLGAIGVLLLWSGNAAADMLPQSDLLTVLCGLVIVALVFMLVTRVPELLLLVALLAIRVIASTPWLFWQQMIAYSVLCVFLFIIQFVWRFLSPAYRLFAPARLSAVLALGGQLLVVLMIAWSGGLFAPTDHLAHVGAGSLVVFALLLLWWGYLQTAYTVRWSFVYTAGLFCSLSVSWELSALAWTQLSTLWLAPAAYLIVIAPFLSRNEGLHGHHQAGQLCAIAGAILLLLPTLWLSFSQNDLQPSQLLLGESLLLLLLGLVTRVRFFVLSSVGLIIVTAIHVLFLPSLGIPTFLALSLMGIFLLVVATALVLVRSRLATLWTKLE